jgi:hypothetical protein
MPRQGLYGFSKNHEILVRLIKLKTIVFAAAGILSCRDHCRERIADRAAKCGRPDPIRQGAKYGHLPPTKYGKRGAGGPTPRTMVIARSEATKQSVNVAYDAHVDGLPRPPAADSQ